LELADDVPDDEWERNDYENIANEYFENVLKRTITSQGRWNTHYREVYRDNRDGRFWEFRYSIGSTEYQNNGIEDLEFFEVEPKEVTVVTYQRIA